MVFPTPKKKHNSWNWEGILPSFGKKTQKNVVFLTTYLDFSQKKRLPVLSDLFLRGQVMIQVAVDCLSRLNPYHLIPDSFQGSTREKNGHFRTPSHLELLTNPKKVVWQQPVNPHVVQVNMTKVGLLNLQKNLGENVCITKSCTPLHQHWLCFFVFFRSQQRLYCHDQASVYTHLSIYSSAVWQHIL